MSRCDRGGERVAVATVRAICSSASPTPAPALIVAPATGGRGFSRSGVQASLISLEAFGNRHRLKPRPPVADGPSPAATMIKALAPKPRPASKVSGLDPGRHLLVEF
jgi:hypothetical protein